MVSNVTLTPVNLTDPLPRLNLVVIRSRELNSARRFYELIGVTFAQHKHGKGLEHLASENSGYVFEIYPLRENDQPTTSTRLGFLVGSCEEVTRKLSAAGYVVRSQPNDSPWGKVAVIEDFDGHKVEVVERKP